jgi:Flp pilus assembly protein TadG
MNRRETRENRRWGAVTVEAALVLPLVLLFLFGIMEFGRFLVTVNVFNNAARAGALYAAKHGDPIILNGTTYGAGTTDITNVVTNDLAGLQLSGQAINIYLSDAFGNNTGTWAGAQPGQYVCVQITGTYQFIMPKLLGMPSTQAMTFQSVMQSEGN